MGDKQTLREAHEEIATLTRDNKRLRAEVEEYAELTGRQARLLHLVADALKGPPKRRNLFHDWSDLPKVATEVAHDARANGRQ